MQKISNNTVMDVKLIGINDKSEKILNNLSFDIDD